MNGIINRSSLGYWIDKNKRMEAAHLLDLCDDVLENTGILVTPFLSLGVSSWLQDLLRGLPIDYLAWGGFNNAERVRIVLTAGMKKEIFFEQAQIALLQVVPFDKTSKLSHRSMLGSLMSLGLDRGVIGDIRKCENNTIVAVTEEIKGYILQKWSNAGSQSINVSACNEAVDILPVTGLEKRIVSASCRLDAVIAASFGISRSSVQERIKLGGIQRNGLVTVKPDLEVKAGDILSCRGKGKIKIMTDHHQTRKGKNAWKIFIYTDI